MEEIIIIHGNTLLFTDPLYYRDGKTCFRHGNFSISPMKLGKYAIKRAENHILISHVDVKSIEKWYPCEDDLIITDSKKVALVDLDTSKIPVTILNVNDLSNFLLLEVCPDPENTAQLFAVRLTCFRQ